ARSHRSTGRPPAAESTSRRTEPTLRVGTSAMSHRTIRMAVADVDHGNETATAVTNPSAICPSRGARAASFTTARSRLRSDMAVAPADLSGFAQGRQSTPCARMLALQHRMKSRIIFGQFCARDRRVPEVNAPGRNAAVLAAQATTQQSDQQVGVFAPPAGIRGVEAVDPFQIAAPNPKVTRARAAPLSPPQPAQRPEGQSQQRCQAIDVAA